MRYKQLIFQMYIVEPAGQRFKSLFDNKTVESVFDFLSQETQVHQMIESTKDNRPAMESIIELLEEEFPFNYEFNLDFNYKYRQIIGSMVRFIMGHYDYFPDKPKKMKKGHYIQSAIVYKRF